MDIQNKTVLVLGGWGLVGSAVCRSLMEEHPKRIIITSLKESEAKEAVAQMKKEYPKTGKNFFLPWWGNVFARHELKDVNREDILGDPKLRRMYIDDIVDELTEPVLHRSALYQLLAHFKPDVVIDCINSATAIAYQDLFQSARDVMKHLKDTASAGSHGLHESIEKLLCTLYVPQLIRHVQIFYKSMNEAGTKVYVKIGTSGTGGMGLNIPYTHSEEKPSSVLLSKSAVAGAHTLLLFLMGRTPDAPITKEIKPTGAIAWKKIGFGQIAKRGKPIELYDCPPEKGISPQEYVQNQDGWERRRTNTSTPAIRVHRYGGERNFFARRIRGDLHSGTDGVCHPGRNRTGRHLRNKRRQHGTRYHQRSRQRHTRADVPRGIHVQ